MGWGGSALTSGGGGGGGGSPPTVSNFSPAAGTPITASTPVEFDVTGPAAMSALTITVHYPETGARETAFDREGFSTNYAQDSRQSVITGGSHFKLVRRGGWFRSPRVVVSGADANGNAVTE